MTVEPRVQRLEEKAGELLDRHEQADTDREFSVYADDPVGFIREVLNDDPWRKQVQIAEAIRDRPLVAVRSCNGAGKDWLTARLALWWTYARGGLTVLTAPTRQQLEEVLMRREVRDAWSAANLPGELHVRALRPAGEGRAGIIAKTASAVSALTGLHDADVFFCISEAQHEDLSLAFDAGFANAVGEGDRIFCYGNPLNPVGPFYSACQPSSDWTTLKIAASDIPNVREGGPVVPGLMTREGVSRIREQYGEQSPFYRARVEAEFPEEAEGSLIRREWLDEAARRHEEGVLGFEAQDQEPVVALDPARYGPDASALVVREGPVIRRIETWAKRQSTSDLIDQVERELYEAGVRSQPSPRPAEHVGDPQGSARGRVVVDEVGVGAGVQDELASRSYRAEGFNGGRSAGNTERFFNRRAEVYWTLRERLEEGTIALPKDEKLFEELLALRWRPTPKGRVQLESKEDLKSRIGRSPDRADAVAMSLAEPAGGFFYVGRA